MVVTIDNFYGVYLLSSVSEKYKGTCYIGFTVNPERRIKQHNSGKLKGGARKTDRKRPWKMVLIIHGFPSNIAGLRFEWAWQHPQISKRLTHVSKKMRGEKEFDFRIRVLSEMLNTSPWKRMPLTVQWLNQEYNRHLDREPPEHMPVAYGPVRARARRHKFDGNNDEYDDEEDENEEDIYEDDGDEVNGNEVKGVEDDEEEKEEDGSDDDSDGECPSLFQRIQQTNHHVQEPTPSAGNTNDNNHKCFICKEEQSSPSYFFLRCVQPGCKMLSHARCLAQEFLKQENAEGRLLVPVEGKCPSCLQLLLWGNLIRKYHGYQQRFQD